MIFHIALGFEEANRIICFRKDLWIRMPEFRKITDFPRGSIYDILYDAYSYDEQNQSIWDSNWKRLSAELKNTRD